MSRGKQYKIGKCIKCGTIFEKRTPNGKSYPQKKFCSYSCSASSYKRSPHQGFQKGNKNPSKNMTKETKMKMSETQKKIGNKPPVLRGDKHPFWKGGITPLKMRIRKSSDWIKWRQKVFKRDKYTCQECGIVGCYLEPHHIKPIKLIGLDSSELFSLKNGITLCRPCHLQTMGEEALFSNKYVEIVA